MSEANVNKKTKGSRKVRTGYVVSDKMQKTIVVELEDRKQHALYGKTIRTNSKVKVHDENEIAGIGDLVRIEETRPLSKDKHFRLVEIVEKARYFSGSTSSTIRIRPQQSLLGAFVLLALRRLKQGKSWFSAYAEVS